MTMLSLSERCAIESRTCDSRTLVKLGLNRRIRANVSTANKFLVDALNKDSRIRYVDASRAFECVRRSLGSSLEWLAGCPVSERYLGKIATRVKVELGAYFDGKGVSGIRVMTYLRGDGESRLVRSTGAENDAGELPKSCMLLIPTGVDSPRIGGNAVYLRIDGIVSHDGRSEFIAHDFLFADEDGKCLAGFGAITEYVSDLDDLPLAMKNVVDGDYDVMALNASVYESWWKHRLLDPDGDVVRIPTAETDIYGNQISLLMERDGVNAWMVSVVVGGDAYSPSELIPRTCAEINAADVLKERERLVDAIRKCDLPELHINFDHIFLDHFERFPEEVQKAINDDPAGMIDKFVDEVRRAIERLRDNPAAWLTTSFNGGREILLELDGDAVATRIQLLAPVYLTDEDRSIDRPTVYVVAALNRNKATGEEHVAFPTVLDNVTVQINRNIMRRAVRNSLGKAA